MFSAGPVVYGVHQVPAAAGNNVDDSGPENQNNQLKDTKTLKRVGL